MIKLLKRIFSTTSTKIINNLSDELNQINNIEKDIQKLSDEELKGRTFYMIEQIRNNRNINDFKLESFAIVREAAHRVLNMRHFDVQIIGGLILNQGMIAEMKTGEGKTLVASLPAYFNALKKEGVHIVTVNDYLATRDSEWIGQIYKFLGLNVGHITNQTNDKDRKIAYQSDITYVTNNEIGFDFLRDNMRMKKNDQVLRSLNYAIVDEVDSILIDEARTPIIISGPVDDDIKIYKKINKLILQLTLEDYELDEKLRTVYLTDAGILKIEFLLKRDFIINEQSNLYDLENLSLIHYINQGLKAHIIFKNNVDYIISHNKVMIIDEFTGRILEGRRYADGLHQAIESKEHVPIQNENQTLATITFQNLFKMYKKLSGMTGTASTEANEFKDIYNLSVISVPTNKTINRIDHNDEIYGNKNDKLKAIINLIKKCHNIGQPVLVGTTSIEKSEEISYLLRKENLQHNILNAKLHEHEASIIAQAGSYKAITIATNMAGRGTDIKLGGNIEMLTKQVNRKSSKNLLYKQSIKDIMDKANSEKEKVIQAGGLFVIGTERHESRRIDNQLRGRAGRQGDPGSSKFFLSLEDDLMRIFASDRISNILRSLGLKNGEAIYHPIINKSIEKAQQKVEFNNYEIRKNLLKFDDIMNEQRNIIYNQRNKVLDSVDLNNFFINFSEQLLKDLITNHTIKINNKNNNFNSNEFLKEFIKIFNIKLEKDFLISLYNKNVLFIELMYIINKLYQQKIEFFKQETIEELERHILLNTIDQIWKEHLYELDCLRQGISLRAYGQKDPLHEYKREAFYLFDTTLYKLKFVYVQKICHMHIRNNY